MGTGWGTPTLIETRNDAVNTFKITSLLSGLTMVVWRDTTFPSKLESVRYELGAGWRPEQTVATADPGSNISQNFGLCVTTGSQVFPTFHLLWDMQDSSYYHVRYSTWVTSTGVWGTPRPIETGNTYSNGTVEIAVPSSLIPVAVWQRGNPIDVLGLPITATLGTATVLDASTSYTVGGTVSANPMGGALAVYTMSGKTAARKFNGTTWAAEAILAQDANALDTLPRIVHDPAGNAIAAWARFDNGLNLRAVLSQLPQNGTWSTRRYIGAMDKEVLLGGLGIDNVGRATVIYAQDENGHNDIWVEQYR